MIKKLIKVPAARTLASVGDSSYVVLSTAQWPVA